MAMNLSYEMLLILLTKYSLLVNFLNSPPADYASFFKTQDVLQVNQLEYKEDALIAYLKKGMVEVSDAAIEEAYNQLGSAKSSKRKDAYKKLLAAGVRALSFVQKGMSSKDPEIKDACKKLKRAIHEKSSNNSADFIKKFYAIRALGELKSSQASELLKVYSASTDVTLAEEAKLSAALCGGKSHKRISGKEAIKELMKMVPDNAGFAGVLDFEQASKGDYLNFLTKIASEDLGKGNPFSVFMRRGMGQFSPVMQMGLNYVGNVRIDAVAAYLSENITPREGYFTFIVKGKFNKLKFESLVKNKMKSTLHKGVEIHHERELAFAFVDNETFVWAIGDGDSLNFTIPIVDKVLAKNSGPKDHMKKAFSMVLEGKTRLAVSGHIGMNTISLIESELSRELDRKNGRQNNDEEDLFEISALKAVLELIKSKNATAWIDDKLNVHFEILRDNDAQKFAKVVKDFDADLRGFFSSAVLKSLERGRDDSLIIAFIDNYDLDIPFAKTGADGNITKAVISVKQLLNIIPMTVIAARF